MPRQLRHPYVIATLWALSLILSSWFLRGTHGGDWVDAALYLAAGVWLATAHYRPRVR